MADDRAPKPAPSPRRRRTDIDPNAPTPPVANERRRRRRSGAESEAFASSAPEAPPAEMIDATAAESVEARSVEPEPEPQAAPPVETPSADPADATRPFRVPRFDEPGAPVAATAAVAASAAVEGPEPIVGTEPVGATDAIEATGPGAATDPVEVTEPVAAIDPVEATEVVGARVPVAAAVTTVEPSSALETDPGRAWLARLEDRSLDPNICPFLRATAEGKLISPIELPDPSNRCAALNEAVPQSLRQQELVCLSSGHVNCPRYLRGSATATETPVPEIRAGRTLTTPIFVSLVILVMTISASAAFVMARGGLVLSGSTASPSAVAAAPSPSVEPSASAAIASPSFAPSPSSSPSVLPSDTPLPSVTPAPTATPRPTSDRYALLKPCPNTPNCWIYTVRHGDNVFSIAHYFGVSTDSIYARNPWLRQTGLRAGQQLRLPPPTR